MTSTQPAAPLKPLRFRANFVSFTDMPSVLRAAFLHQTDPSHPSDYLIEDAQKAQELLAAVELLLPQMSQLPESLNQKITSWASGEVDDALEPTPEFLAQQRQTCQKWLAENLETLITVLGQYAHAIKETPGSAPEGWQEGQLARIHAMGGQMVELRMYVLARGEITPRANSLMDQLLAQYEVIKLRSQNGPIPLPEAADLRQQADAITAQEKIQAQEAKAAKAALRKSRRQQL